MSEVEQRKGFTKIATFSLSGGKDRSHSSVAHGHHHHHHLQSTVGEEANHGGGADGHQIGAVVEAKSAGRRVERQAGSWKQARGLILRENSAASEAARERGDISSGDFLSEVRTAVASSVAAGRCFFLSRLKCHRRWSLEPPSCCLVRRALVRRASALAPTVPGGCNISVC